MHSQADQTTGMVNECALGVRPEAGEALRGGWSREDGQEGDVFSLIGPKRYDAPWKDLMATDLLVSMATDSVKDGGCPGTENSDGDNYFCLPKTSGASTDLADVFQVAVAQLTGHSRLVNVE